MRRVLVSIRPAPHQSERAKELVEREAARCPGAAATGFETFMKAKTSLALAYPT